MKNDKLPLKERYNNFIQKHPKFWLTLIYGVLMLALAIAMFIAAFSPPANETASADFRRSKTCPAPPTTISENYVMFTSPGLWDKEELINDYFHATVSRPAGYFVVSAVLYRQAAASPLSLYSYRFLNFYAFFDDNGLVSDIYLFYSNTRTIYTPDSPNIPADAMSVVPVSDTSKFPLYASDFSFHSICTRYIKNGIDRFIASKTCPVFSNSCSPDDLKAEYDKGHADGYNNGYNVGYDKGKVDGAELVSVSPITFLLSPISSLLGTPIWGQFTIGSLFSVVLFVGCTLIFIKMFAGG